MWPSFFSGGQVEWYLVFALRLARLTMGIRCPLEDEDPALLSGSAISRGRSVDSKAGEYISFFLYILGWFIIALSLV